MKFNRPHSGFWRGVLLTVLMAAVVGAGWISLKEYARRAVESAKRQGPASGPVLTRPAGPSLAVVTFDNRGDDPDLDYLGGGISESLAVRLAGLPGLFVIAPRSALAFGGRNPELEAIARRLGVRYVLSGDVLRLAGFIQVTARLYDADKQSVLWEQAYDQRYNEFFGVLDEIAMAATLHSGISPPAPERLAGIDTTSDVQAFDLYLRARELARRGEAGTNFLAIHQLQTALERQPDFSKAMGELGWRYWQGAQQGWIGDGAEALKNAWFWAEKSLSQGPDLGGLTLLARSYPSLGRHGEAVALGRRAVRAFPGSARAQLALANALTLAGEPARALPFFSNALRLDPLPHPEAALARAWALLLAGRGQQAIEAFSVVVVQGGEERAGQEAWLGIVAAHGWLDHPEAARVLADTLRREHAITRSGWEQGWLARGVKDTRISGRILRHLEQAGLR